MNTSASGMCPGQQTLWMGGTDVTMRNGTFCYRLSSGVSHHLKSRPPSLSLFLLGCLHMSANIPGDKHLSPARKSLITEEEQISCLCHDQYTANPDNNHHSRLRNIIYALLLTSGTGLPFRDPRHRSSHPGSLYLVDSCMERASTAYIRPSW